MTIISRFFVFALGDKDLGRLFVGFLRALAAVFIFFLLTTGDRVGYNVALTGHIPSSLRNIDSKSVRDGYNLRPVVRPKEYSSECRYSKMV